MLLQHQKNVCDVIEQKIQSTCCQEEESATPTDIVDLERAEIFDFSTTSWCFQFRLPIFIWISLLTPCFCSKLCEPLNSPLKFFDLVPHQLKITLSPLQPLISSVVSLDFIALPNLTQSYTCSTTTLLLWLTSQLIYVYYTNQYLLYYCETMLYTVYYIQEKATDMYT